MKPALILNSFLLVLTVSCKKKITDSPVPELPRIKTYTSSAGISSTYKQDALGRLKESIYTDGSRGEIVYTAGMATINFYNPAGALIDQTICELNSEGLVIKEYPAGFPPGRVYEYDASKRNSRYYSTSANGDFNEHRDYYSASGLLDSSTSKSTSVSGTLVSHGKVVYEYVGASNNTIGNYNYGYLHLGKNCDRLPSKKTTMNILSGSQGTTNYFYEYDTQNRVIRQTATTSAGNQQVFTFTYY